MAKLYRKPYFHSDLFVAWMQTEADINAGGDRSEIVDHIYRLARRGQFQIYTSSLTLAEVQRDNDDYLLTFLENEFFVIVDLDRTVGEEANRLCRQYNISPSEAVHLASADRAGCDVLLTWNAKLLEIEHGRVATEGPIMVGQLSMEIDTAQMRSFQQVPASEL